MPVTTGRLADSKKSAYDIDITVKGSPHFGPKWKEMVEPMRAAVATGNPQVIKAAWEDYSRQYLQLLKDRFRQNPQPFLAIIDSPHNIVLRCHEANARYCHRSLLAAFLQQVDISRKTGKPIEITPQQLIAQAAEINDGQPVSFESATRKPLETREQKTQMPTTTEKPAAPVTTPVLDIPKTTVFISGSLGTKSLTPPMLQRLNAIMQQNYHVLVGDAPGADTLVQRYLAAKNYPHVTVYTTTAKARNNIGNWTIRIVPGTAKGKEFFTAKDRQMVQDATYGLALWDGKSEGTARNIEHLKSLGKGLVVIDPKGTQIIRATQPVKPASAMPAEAQAKLPVTDIATAKNIRFTSGNIFDSPAQVYINPVNTEGVMGAGLAKQFKERFPENYQDYLRAHREGRLRTGALHIFHNKGGTPEYIVNFPTKAAWRDPSKIEYIQDGLRSLVPFLKERNIRSVAIPMLGSGLGGLDWEKVRPLIVNALQGLPTEVHIFGTAPVTKAQTVTDTPKTQTVDAPKTTPIREFQHQYRFLSNFYAAPVVFEGKKYPTAEHAYQAAKTTDPALREKISMVKSPAEAKRLGAKLPLRPDWDKIKLQVMHDIVNNKFRNNPELQKLLLNTGTAELVEGNRWRDTFWGVDINTGEGKNHLGRILMDVRTELQGGTAQPKAVTPAKTRYPQWDAETIAHIEAHERGERKLDDVFEEPRKAPLKTVMQQVTPNAIKEWHDKLVQAGFEEGYINEETLSSLGISSESEEGLALLKHAGIKPATAKELRSSRLRMGEADWKRLRIIGGIEEEAKNIPFHVEDARAALRKTAPVIAETPAPAADLPRRTQVDLITPQQRQELFDAFARYLTQGDFGQLAVWRDKYPDIDITGIIDKPKTTLQPRDVLVETLETAPRRSPALTHLYDALLLNTDKAVKDAITGLYEDDPQLARNLMEDLGSRLRIPAEEIRTGQVLADEVMAERQQLIAAAKRTPLPAVPRTSISHALAYGQTLGLSPAQSRWLRALVPTLTRDIWDKAKQFRLDEPRYFEVLGQQVLDIANEQIKQAGGIPKPQTIELTKNIGRFVQMQRDTTVPHGVGLGAPPWIRAEGQKADPDWKEKTDKKAKAPKKGREKRIEESELAFLKAFKEQKKQQQNIPKYPIRFTQMMQAAFKDTPLEQITGISRREQAFDKLLQDRQLARRFGFTHTQMQQINERVPRLPQHVLNEAITVSRFDPLEGERILGEGFLDLIRQERQARKLPVHVYTPDFARNVGRYILESQKRTITPRKAPERVVVGTRLLKQALPLTEQQKIPAEQQIRLAVLTERGHAIRPNPLALVTRKVPVYAPGPERSGFVDRQALKPVTQQDINQALGIEPEPLRLSRFDHTRRAALDRMIAQAAQVIPQQVRKQGTTQYADALRHEINKRIREQQYAVITPVREGTAEAKHIHRRALETLHPIPKKQEKPARAPFAWRDRRGAVAMHVLPKMLLPLGIGLEAAHIARSPDRPRAMAEAAGGWLADIPTGAAGAKLGAKLGAKIGTGIFPVVGTVVGGLVGGGLGHIAGRIAGGEVMDALRTRRQQNYQQGRRV